MIERIQSLAKLFTELTANPVVMSYLTMGQAREWLNCGFTEDDLRLMVKYRRRVVKETGILKAMLRWRFLIGDPQRFAEDLPEARAYFRNTKKPVTDRERTLAVTGRETIAPDKTKTAAQVLSAAGQKAFEEFKAFRQRMEQL